MEIVAEGPDRGLVRHYGDPLAEQRRIESGRGAITLTNRTIVRLGAERRWTWTEPGDEDRLVGPGAGVVCPELTVRWQGRQLPAPQAALAQADSPVAHGVEYIIPRDSDVACGDVVPGGSVLGNDAARDDGLADPERVGTWAWEAIRIACGVPRAGFDLADPADSEKLVRLLLDGSVERLPGRGEPVCWFGRQVGTMGTSSYHYELGPIGLAVVAPGAWHLELCVDGVAAAVEPLDKG